MYTSDQPLSPLDGTLGQTLALAGWGFCGMGVMLNQIHQWAHMPVPPRGVAVLQAAGLLLRPHDHKRHHGLPYDGEYCITTGWWNRPLDASAFFRRLECAVTRVTGAQPRHDEQHSSTHRHIARSVDGAHLQRAAAAVRATFTRTFGLMCWLL